MHKWLYFRAGFSRGGRLHHTQDLLLDVWCCVFDVCVAFFFAAAANEINFLIFPFPYLHLIATRKHFEIDDIFIKLAGIHFFTAFHDIAQPQIHGIILLGRRQQFFSYNIIAFSSTVLPERRMPVKIFIKFWSMKLSACRRYFYKIYFTYKAVKKTSDCTRWLLPLCTITFAWCLTRWKAPNGAAAFYCFSLLFTIFYRLSTGFTRAPGYGRPYGRVII